MYRDRDYHGTTAGAMSSSGQIQRKERVLARFSKGSAEFPHRACSRCSYDKTYGDCNIECARKVQDMILKEGAEIIGGLIVEPITAGGGILKPVPEYFLILQEICSENTTSG